VRSLYILEVFSSLLPLVVFLHLILLDEIKVEFFIL
jgi:hypothetical protein